MSWSAVDPLDSPKYKALTSITRSLHLGNAMASYGKQRLMSHKIVSKRVDLSVKVLWFAPTRPMEENNTYGNVSFTLDWETALQQLGPYLYFVDQHENDTLIYSRVLLTDKEYDFLTSVDEGGNRMPMLKCGAAHYAATLSDGWKHVLEIGVEVDRQKEKWIYLNCRIQANDHSFANSLLYKDGPYNSCYCHRFNYFENECPSPYKIQKTTKILNKKCPSMLCDGPERSSSAPQSLPKTNKQVAPVKNKGHAVVKHTVPARETQGQTPAVKSGSNKKTPATTHGYPTNQGAVGYASSSTVSSSSALGNNGSSKSGVAGYNSSSGGAVGYVSSSTVSSSSAYRNNGSSTSGVAGYNSSSGRAVGYVSSSTVSSSSAYGNYGGSSSGVTGYSSSSGRAVGYGSSSTVTNNSAYGNYGSSSSGVAGYSSLSNGEDFWNHFTQRPIGYTTNVRRSSSASGKKPDGMSTGDKVLAAAFVAGLAIYVLMR